MLPSELASRLLAYFGNAATALAYARRKAFSGSAFSLQYDDAADILSGMVR